jgi:hypothetical protein
MFEFEGAIIRRIRRRGKYYIYAFDKRTGKILAWGKWSSKKSRREDAYKKIKEKITIKIKREFVYYFRTGWAYRKGLKRVSPTWGVTVNGLVEYSDLIDDLYVVYKDYLLSFNEKIDEEVAYDKRVTYYNYINAYLFDPDNQHDLRQVLKIDMQNKQVILMDLTKEMEREVKEVLDKYGIKY